MKRTKLFFTNLIILISTSIFIRFIDVGFKVYISKMLGNDGIGILQLVMSVYLFGITIASSGINLATTRIIAEELAINPNDSLKKAGNQCILYSLFFGLLASLLIFTNANFIVNTFMHNKVSLETIYIMCISFPFISVSSAISGYFTGIRKVSRNSCSTILEQILKLFICFFLLNVFIEKGLDFALCAIVLGNVFSEIISCLFSYILYLYDSKKFRKRTSKSFIQKMIKISLPVALTSYLRSGLSTFKQLLVPLKLEKASGSCSNALSSYGLINGMSMPILMFPCAIINSFSSLLIPEISSFYVQKNISKIVYVINKIFKMTFIFSICIIGVFIVFANDLSFLIYNNLEISPYLRLLAPLIVFIYLDNIIDSILKGLNKQVSVMLCNILDLFVSISLIYILIPLYNINGYIMVFYVSEILNFFISLIILLRLIKFKFNFKNWIILPCFGIVLSSYIVNLLNLPFCTLNSIFKILIFITVYILFLFSASCLTLEDFRIFKRK